ncbi:MAG: hypothetical protein F6K10_24880 [Moorea sp. SIO2B7]|nr:hypothetical protein [Moorena sp. SIO2B7]
MLHSELLFHFCQLVIDYELFPEMSEAMIYAAMVPLMLGRLAQTFYL